MSLYNDNSTKFSNQNLNSVGSEYAAQYGHDISLLVQKLTNRAIFDAKPQQFMDLKLMNMVEPIPANSDEFFFQEMGYQREPLVATGAVGAVTYPATQAIPVTSVENIATNTIITYPNGQHGSVTDVDTTTLTITVTPYTGDTLPAVAADDVIANMSSVDHDGSDGFAQYFRASTIERNNYIQLFNKAIRYNEGQVITANGTPAKTTGGVYTSMVEAGSPNALATSATLVDAFEDVVLNSEYGDYGSVRMAFLTPRMHRLLSKAYKDELTRYQPNDEIAILNLKEVNIGSSRIVLVPFKRFEDEASFPASFANKIVILDMKNIRRRQLWGERSGDTLKLEDGVPKRYGDIYVDCNMGVEMYNPLACAWVDVQL
jgi:hypothetical protein